MTRSMTAYAGTEREVRGWLFAFEVRSVNHRYLDLSMRLPEAFRFLEPEIRNRVGVYFKRGRVELTLSSKKTGAGEADIRVHRELVAKLLATARELEGLSGRPLGPFSALDLLQWPGVLYEPEADSEELAAELLQLLTETLEKAVGVREVEGRQLAALIEERSIRLAAQVSSARVRLPEVLEAVRQKITTRLAEVSASPDADRLEQEMVYLAQKLDIAEELDRLDTHVAEILRTLRQAEPVGRRLDFLLQELNREANTLGSKSADTETTRAAVEMKVLIEQMREQIQNIE